MTIFQVYFNVEKSKKKHNIKEIKTQKGLFIKSFTLIPN